MATNLQLNHFFDLFTGNTKNYGQHTYNFSDKGNKEKGGNKTVTNKLLTIQQYKDHLNGKVGLGVIPITEDGKCRFAVIDVDVYDKSFDVYIDAIERFNFPLVPFYSKSGGLHIYVFFNQAVKAKAAVDVVRKVARVIGISLFVKQHKNEALEIFPKQTKLNPGQTGNWINLPYFNAKDTKQGMIKDGKMLELNEALVEIQKRTTSLTELEDLLNDLPYGDAPPCLQTLNILNLLGANNGRNNYLFSFGVYLKKKDENYFEQAVMELNNNLAKPLDVEEVENTILKSLRRKDYTYKCTEAPCRDFCDKKVCRSREYGVGKDGGYFTNLLFGNLVQFNTASPYYEWEVKAQEGDTFKNLRFKNEDEIIKQDVFLRLCFRELHFLPFKMKQVEWFKLVNQALNDIKVISIERADDTSPMVRFYTLFYDFLTGRALAKTKRQILSRRVYFDEDNEAYYFRVKDLVEYLYDYKNFRLFNSAEIHGMLRDVGIFKKVVRDEESGRQIRVVGLHRDKIDLDYLMSIQTEETYEVDFDNAYEEEQAF